MDSEGIIHFSFFFYALMKGRIATISFGCLCAVEERRNHRVYEQEARELLMAEVSIYTDDCGEIQFHCLNDCLGGGAWLNIEY